MDKDLLWALITVVNAFVMLFQLRSLMQSSSADYYHPFTQAVTRLTNPLVNVSVWRQVRVGSFFAAGFIVSMVIAFSFWVGVHLFFRLPLTLSLAAAIIMIIKGFGYLIMILLFAQALCSWLPATRSFSILCAQITYPIVRPVQRIIPPIGMIDISLMIVMFLLFALNGVAARILFSISPNLGSLWVIM